MLSGRCLSCLSVCLSVCNVGVLWPNGWTDQDETRHAGRPRPSPHCIRCGASSPSPKGARPPPIFGPYQLRPNGCMDQDVTWYEAIGLGQGDFVLDGDHAPLPKRGWTYSPIFGPFLLWPYGWMHHDATWYGGRPQPRGLCVRWGLCPLPKRRRIPGTGPPLFGPRVLWPNGWMDQDGT